MTLICEDLVELRLIEELKYRYLRFLDLKMWGDLEQLLMPEATASYGGGAYVRTGRDAIMEFLRSTMASESVLTSHKAHHPEIALLDDRQQARATWALDDVVVQQEHQVTIRGAAFYDDTYVKVDGDWLIASTGYKRVYEEIYPRTSLHGLRVTGDYWSTGGRSTLTAG